MTSRELEIFHAIMCSRSLTEAASSLHISQPAMSKAIKRLEDKLRLPLFRRVKGRLRPTQEAESLFPEAGRLMREINGLSRTATELRDGEAGLVRVAASSSLGLSIVPTAIATFATAYPRVKIVSHFTGAVGIANLILGGNIDVGMTLSPITAPGTASQSVATIPIVCAMHETHKLAAKSTIRPRDLDGMPLISFGSDTLFGQLLDEAFARDGRERRVSIELIIGVQAVPLVHRNAGVALVDGYMQSAGFAGIAWRPFEPEVNLPVSVITSTMRPTSRLAHRLIDHFIAAIQAVRG